MRNRGRYKRRVRHENWGLRHCVLGLQACKCQCQACGRYFRERFPGIQPFQDPGKHFINVAERQPRSPSTATDNE